MESGEFYRPSSTIITASHLAMMMDRAVMITVMLTFVLNQTYIDRTPLSMLLGVALSLAFNVVMSMAPVCRKASKAMGPNKLLIGIVSLAGAGCLLYALDLHPVADIVAIGIIAASRPTEPVLVSDLVSSSTVTEFINRGRMQTLFRVVGTGIGVITNSIESWDDVKIVFSIYAALYFCLALVLVASEAKLGPFRTNPADESAGQHGLQLVQTVRPLPFVRDVRTVPMFLRSLKIESFWLTVFEMLLLCNCFYLASPRGKHATIVVLVVVQVLAGAMLVFREIDVEEMFNRYFTYKLILLVLSLVLLWVPAYMGVRSDDDFTDVNSHSIQAVTLVINTIAYLILMQYIDMGPLFWTKTTQEEGVYPLTAADGTVAAGQGVRVHFNEVQWINTLAELIMSLVYLFLLPLTPIMGLVLNILLPPVALLAIKSSRVGYFAMKAECRGRAVGDPSVAVRSERKWTAGAYDFRFFPSGVNPKQYAAVSDDSNPIEPGVALTALKEDDTAQMEELDSIVKKTEVTATVVAAVAPVDATSKTGGLKKDGKHPLHTVNVRFSVDDVEVPPSPGEVESHPTAASSVSGAPFAEM